MANGEHEAKRKAGAYVRLFAVPNDDGDNQRRLSAWGLVGGVASLNPPLRQEVKVFMLLTAVDRVTGKPRYEAEARLVAGLPGELQLLVVRHLIALHGNHAADEYRALATRAAAVRLPTDWRRHTIISLDPQL